MGFTEQWDRFTAHCLNVLDAYLVKKDEEEARYEERRQEMERHLDRVRRAHDMHIHRTPSSSDRQPTIVSLAELNDLPSSSSSSTAPLRDRIIRNQHEDNDDNDEGNNNFQADSDEEEEEDEILERRSRKDRRRRIARTIVTSVVAAEEEEEEEEEEGHYGPSAPHTPTKTTPTSESSFQSPSVSFTTANKSPIYQSPSHGILNNVEQDSNKSDWKTW
eukprot:CAMPEP_0114393364 /NCGR_PEP_ID=MMETSP0102-20121206/11448_1 /TAXON_ID=38822 ORGANISM="Pteridomonas danica, Strain PT" /NCGR_SAMPLE_ID=MMETSP0102 /ASSEMBLY_ACC=CAM_ASM_000212 /LENGTH=217 /DNA_ID=CAMNT_0001552917 /DNA_START=316 /DNA_END=966 /DNA_ORIENTATION=-